MSCWLLLRRRQHACEPDRYSALHRRAVVDVTVAQRVLSATTAHLAAALPTSQVLIMIACHSIAVIAYSIDRSLLCVGMLAACAAGTYNAMLSQSSSAACLGEWSLASHLSRVVVKVSCAVLWQCVRPAPTRRRRRHRAHVNSRLPPSIDAMRHAPSLAECPSGSYCGASTAASNITGAASMSAAIVVASGRCTACPAGYFCAAGSTPTNISGAAHWLAVVSCDLTTCSVCGGHLQCADQPIERERLPRCRCVVFET